MWSSFFTKDPIANLHRSDLCKVIHRFVAQFDSIGKIIYSSFYCTFKKGFV